MSKPSGRRTILCPRCDTSIETSVSAKSIPCPGCHRNIRTEDEVVSDYQARVEYYNEGHVEVAKKGIIIAEVRVRSLVVKGEVKGPVRVRETAHLTKTGKVIGDLSAPSLIIDEGAVLVGRVEIGPKRPAPPPANPTRSLDATGAVR